MAGRISRLAPAFAAAVGIGLAGAADAATFFVQTTVGARGSASTPAEQQFLNSTSSVSLTASAAYTDTVDTASSTAFAAAAPGALKAIATASSRGDSAPAGVGFAQARAEGGALWRDSFVLQSTGVPAGTTGTIIVDVLLDYTMTAVVAGEGRSGATDWFASVRLGSTSYTFSASRFLDPTTGVLSQSGDPSGIQTIELPVVFGQLNTVTMELGAGANAGTGRSAFGPLGDRAATFSTDFGSTLTWEGISSVIVDGQQLTSFTAVSETGFDFREGVVGAPGVAPVPEPSAWALMMAGFGLAGWGLRRRGFAAEAWSARRKALGDASKRSQGGSTMRNDLTDKSSDRGTRRQEIAKVLSPLFRSTQSCTAQTR